MRTYTAAAIAARQLRLAVAFSLGLVLAAWAVVGMAQPVVPTATALGTR